MKFHLFGIIVLPRMNSLTQPWAAVQATHQRQTMKITMLGTGAALPDPDRGQSALLITTESGKHYLFDCGEGATRQMVRADINPADVGLVFLTHLHHDHISDFPYFVISSWMLVEPSMWPASTKRAVIPGATGWGST